MKTLITELKRIFIKNPLGIILVLVLDIAETACLSLNPKTANEMFSVENVQTMLERIKPGTISLEQIHFPNADIQQKMVGTIVSFDAQQLTEMIRKTIPDFSTLLDQCFYSAKDGIREQTKMVCLSESIKSPLMWAHYADNNKGFALGYDFTNNDI